MRLSKTIEVLADLEKAGQSDAAHVDNDVRWAYISHLVRGRRNQARLSSFSSVALDIWMPECLRRTSENNVNPFTIPKT